MNKQLLICCASTAAILTYVPAFANEELLKRSQNPKEWVMPAGDYASQRYTALKQITPDNVKSIAPAWTFSTGVLRGHEGGPLILGDVMYVHTPFPNIVYALDLNNEGKILWKYEPKQDPNVIAVMCCDTVNRGLAYGDGKIFLYQADTTLVALDAKTGGYRLVSEERRCFERARQARPHPSSSRTRSSSESPAANMASVASMTAYSLKDGKLAWKAYSTGPDNEMLIDPEKTTSLGKPVGKDSSLESWKGDQWKIGGGATWGWTPMILISTSIYYGSGNPSTWNPTQRPGDNKWSMAIWARNADTGVAKWVYQMTPHDEWDYDGVNEMILTDQTIGDKSRKLLTHFDRNGFGYTLDRADGELLVAQKFDPGVNWASAIDMDKGSRNYGRPIRVAKYSTDANGEDANTKGICPFGARCQRPAARRLFAADANSSMCPPTMSAWIMSPSR